jgi:hypothetical protein
MRAKILIGIASATMWFVFSQAANAERVCRQVCDHGTCVSKCVENSGPGVIVHEHDRYRDERNGPGVDIHAPGVNVDIGR